MKDIEERQDNVINITNVCNQYCIFCSGFSDEPVCREEVLKRIDASESEVFFQGGEPTLSDNLVDYIRYAKGQDKIVTLVTNGIRLSYMPYAKALFDAGLDQVFFAFHASVKELSDRLSRFPSYGYKKKALDNIRRLGKAGTVRIIFVISKHNMHDISAFIRFIDKRFPQIRAVELKLMQVLGNPEKNMDNFPRIEDFQDDLIEALEFGQRVGMNIMTNGIPLCYLGGHHKSAVEYDMKSKGKENLTGRTYLDCCKGCGNKGLCMGYRSDYASLFKL